MLTLDQKTTFAERGMIRVERFIAESTLAPARDLVYDTLSKAGLWHDDTWSTPADAKQLRMRMKALKQRAKSNAFKHLLTPEVLNTARELVDGRAIRVMDPQTQLLFTPPDPSARWAVPHNIWHLDYARLGELGAPGVQMFAFIDTVLPGGGGTLLVAGSHRLLNDNGVLGSKEVKRRLKREDYFRELMNPHASDRDRFMSEPGHVDDVAVQVVELTGDPGDVFFTDLRLLHTLGPNTSHAPRIMVTQRFALESVAKDMGDAYAELAATRKRGPPAAPEASRTAAAKAVNP